MLREINHVQTAPSDYLRRWFADENQDLIVWYKPDQTIYGFQLCYDRYWRHRALTWTEDRGFSHGAIDDGEQNPLSERAPILKADGPFEVHAILSRFRKSARFVPIQTRNFVRQKIREYARKKGLHPWTYPVLGFSLGVLAGVGFFTSCVMLSERSRVRSAQAAEPF